MRADNVVKEDKHGNEVVGRSKRRKALFGFVPSHELLVEALDGGVGDVIVEILYADVFYPIQRLNRHLVGKITADYNGLRNPHRLHGFRYGESLWDVPVRGKTKAEDKASFAVQNETEEKRKAKKRTAIGRWLPVIGMQGQSINTAFRR